MAKTTMFHRVALSDRVIVSNRTVMSMDVLTDETVVLYLRSGNRLPCDYGLCYFNSIMEVPRVGPVTETQTGSGWQAFPSVHDGIVSLVHILDGPERTVSVKEFELSSISDSEYRAGYFSKIGGVAPPPPPACPFGDVAVIAARGSGEDNTVVGSPGDYGRVFKAELEKRLGDTVSVTLAGVDYPAVKVDSNTMALYGSSVNDGVEALKVGLTNIVDLCSSNLPRIVLIGYSQGANVIQGALEEIADDPVLGSLPTSVGFFASPMFTYTDPSARGTFAHSATGVAGTSIFVADASVHTAAVPDAYSDITRTWCIAGDPVCDSSAKNVRSKVFGDSTHTGAGYGVFREGDSTGEFTGGHAMADVLATAIWALGRSGLTIPEPPAPVLSGLVSGEGLSQSVLRLRAGVTYSGYVFWSAAAVVNTAGPVQFYLWDFDGDGLHDQSGPSPIGIYEYSLSVPRGTKETFVKGSVEIVGANRAISTYELCFDVKKRQPCRTQGGF